MKCKAIGFLVHWITLACFLAMFAEALCVYLAIVVAFDTHVSHIVVKVSLFCWGKISKNLQFTLVQTASRDYMLCFLAKPFMTNSKKNKNPPGTTCCFVSLFAGITKMKHYR